MNPDRPPSPATAPASLRFPNSPTPPSPNAAAPAARTVIIEPNGAKADLLAYFCTNSWGFDVIALEKTALRGIAAVNETKPELILAALTPADVPAVELIFQLRKASPVAKLVLLATQCSEYLLHAIGSSEYHGLIYEPDESMTSIGAAVARVREGFRFVSSRMRECQQALRIAPAAFPKLLSKREQQVLVCIAHSFSDEEIARDLGVSPGTALSHRRRLMNKLGIHSTPKLIRYCVEKGFNSVPPFPRTAANREIGRRAAS
jgi:DNA-binding NarL/FixJ family response regulator